MVFKKAHAKQLPEGYLQLVVIHANFFGQHKNGHPAIEMYREVMF
jgi:hypothetical protein